jgi:phytoene synthase
MQVSLPDLQSSAAADLAACRNLLRGGSRSFYVASLFLPRRVKEPAIALYAFCRVADDAIDMADTNTPHAKLDALETLRLRLDRLYAGRPLPFAADRALARVVSDFAIPRPILYGLLEGLEWDVEGRRYETLSDLTAYAARVAGTVGAAMALLMGRRDPAIVAYACDLGIAMQLTNIARDVGEDARAGRVYLPLQWMREAGIDLETWLQRPIFTPEIGNVVARLLASADQFYQRAEAGLARLPLDCQPGIRAARHLYAEIGRVVERNGCDSVSCRARVGGTRKAQLLAEAVLSTLISNRSQTPALTEEARFIVDALATALPLVSQKPLAAWCVAPRAIWVLDLFERLERREREQGIRSVERA